VQNYGRTRKATDENKLKHSKDARIMTHTTFNTYCFPMATVITQKHLNVMSYIWYTAWLVISVLRKTNISTTTNTILTLLKQHPFCSSYSFQRKTNKFFYSLSI
jgi:hypothetical protein